MSEKVQNGLGSSHGLCLYRSISAIMVAGSGHEVTLFCK